MVRAAADGLGRLVLRRREWEDRSRLRHLPGIQQGGGARRGDGAPADSSHPGRGRRRLPDAAAAARQAVGTEAETERGREPDRFLPAKVVDAADTIQLMSQHSLLLIRQSTLFAERPACDSTLAGLARTDLGGGAWIDHLSEWVRGHET